MKVCILILAGEKNETKTGNAAMKLPSRPKTKFSLKAISTAIDSNKRHYTYLV